MKLPIEGEPAAWLRKVRYGEISFDELWARSLELDAVLDGYMTDESVPEGPNRSLIEEWSASAHMRMWADVR